MSLWGRIFAGLYDGMMSKTERDCMVAHRRALLAGATGDVLEIGGGTGANLSHYNGTTRLTVTEPEKPMLRRLRKRAEESAPGTTVLEAPAEKLPFEDGSFDTVVSTLVLCTVGDQPQALREVHRVLRPGGRLLFIEHVRSEDEKVGRLQDRMRPINVRIGHGCTCNRQTVDAIRTAGFEVTQVEHGELTHAPPWVRPLVVGVAQRAAA